MKKKRTESKAVRKLNKAELLSHHGCKQLRFEKRPEELNSNRNAYGSETINKSIY